MASAAGNTLGRRSVGSTGVIAGVLSSRRNVVILVALAALLAGVVGISMLNRSTISDLFNRGSEALVQGAQAAGKSPLASGIAALLEQRSPGQRTAGELANNKHRYAQNIPHHGVPHQRALAKTQPALPVPFVKALTVPAQEVVPVPVESLATPLQAPMIQAKARV